MLQIEGKNVRFNQFATESDSEVLDTVYALLGLTERPTDDGGTEKVDMAKGYTKEVTVMEIMNILRKRFNITTTAFPAGQSEKMYKNLAKIYMVPELATKITNKVVLVGKDLLDEKITELNPCQFQDLDGYIKIDAKANISIFNSSDKYLGKINVKDNTFTPSATISESDIEDIIAAGLTVMPNVIVLDPIKQIEVKAMPKSIVVEAIKDEVKPADKPEVKAESKSKSEVKVETKPEIKVEKDKDGVKTTTITNPEQTITLEDTKQIAVRIDIELVKKYINIDSLNKNAPKEFKAKIIQRLERALKAVLADKDHNKYLNPNKKYGMVKSGFFGEETYTLYNGKLYMKILDAENFEFNSSLN